MKNLKSLSFLIWLLSINMGCFQERWASGNRRATTPRVDDIYATTTPTQLATIPPASYQIFYDELSPYGSWIDNPTYGYVWIPRVSFDFHPYATHGHWVMTNYGWTWVSDFRWGWAAFHYGRWAYEPVYGWLWVPGSAWSPAWVDWRESEDYYGWAPLSPFMDITVVVNCPHDHYRFVPRRHFAHRNVYNYYVDRRQNTTIINHTTVINETHVVNNTRYYNGPRKDMVERASGQTIRTSEVVDNPKPDADIESKDRVKVYRPRVDIASTDTRKPAPKKVVDVAELPSIPSDARLTPSVKREKPQNTDRNDIPSINTEGGTVRPQDKPTMKQVPRREDVPQDKPDITPPTPPIEKPRPLRDLPRREEMPQDKPDIIPQPTPPVEKPRPQRDVPRREDIPQRKPDATPPPKVKPRPQETPRPSRTQPQKEEPQKDKVTPLPVKEKPKKNGRDDN
jgi:hypothetical protein